MRIWYLLHLSAQPRSHLPTRHKDREDANPRAPRPWRRREHIASPVDPFLLQHSYNFNFKSIDASLLFQLPLLVGICKHFKSVGMIKHF